MGVVEERESFVHVRLQADMNEHIDECSHNFLSPTTCTEQRNEEKRNLRRSPCTSIDANVFLQACTASINLNQRTGTVLLRYWSLFANRFKKNRFSRTLCQFSPVISAAQFQPIRAPNSQHGAQVLCWCIWKVLPKKHVCSQRVVSPHLPLRHIFICSPYVANFHFPRVRSAKVLSRPGRPYITLSWVRDSPPAGFSISLQSRTHSTSCRLCVCVCEKVRICP